MKRLCTICARGGSKGVKNKNLRLLGGRPLLAHSIAHARSSNLFQQIAVSSDSEDILSAAREFGADILVRRPEVLATDTAPKVPAILHAVEQAQSETGTVFDTLVDLDATSPLRVVADIAGAVKLLEESGVRSVITGAVAHRSPYFNLVERDPHGFVRVCKTLPGGNVVRRQDVPPCFDMNASIYVWSGVAFRQDARVFYDDTKLFEMPQERSLDIDSELDFEIVQFLFDRASLAGATS
jgi:CMP-N,N'-diacetyllegionaminic acid synthase